MKLSYLYRLSFSLILIHSASPALLAAGPLDASTWETVDKILGRPGKVFPGDIHKYGWPRADLHVTTAGVVIEPTLALGSWGGFMKTSTEGHLMTMGDLVLLSDEVNPVVRALQAGGLDVLAIHNHLIGESPQVMYVHFGGHGPAEQVARALRTALEMTKTPFAASAAPPASPSAGETGVFDKLQAALGRKGSIAGRVLQVGVPRAATIEEDGMEVPPSMGMATALNFQVVENRVATTGDFVMTADEVNPVIKELQAYGVQVTALHSHMLRETPRLFFMHFWGLDDPARIGEGLKATLSKMAVAP